MMNQTVITQLQRFTVLGLVVATMSMFSGEALAQRPSLQDLLDRTADLEEKLANVSVVEGEMDGLAGPHVIIEGANLHVRNSTGNSSINDARGNVIIGWNEESSPGGEMRTASHNLIVGSQHTYTAALNIISGLNNSTTPTGFCGIIVGQGNELTAAECAVFGLNNTASGFVSFVAGGENNTASGERSFVSGTNNIASGLASFVAGGEDNTASGGRSFVTGNSNTSANSSTFVSGTNNTSVWSNSFIGGGQLNTTSGIRSFVGGGINNTASADAFVAGGEGNTASGELSFVSGKNNIASGFFSFVAGGEDNTAFGGRSFVGGTLGSNANRDQTAILGGTFHEVGGDRGAIVGGNNNTITLSANDSVIAGGGGNTATLPATFIGGN